MAEASLHERNSFLTLTYDDAHVPADGNLSKTIVPDFIESLRKRRRKPDPPCPVRYYQCGEYGEKRKRPHYHVALFGEDFRESRVPMRRRGSRFPEWISSEMCELWPSGQHLIGSLSFESAAYIARYVVDKVTGSRAESHYEEVDCATGELRQRTPEFATMSRRPGIGSGWLERYRSDVYPSDEVRMSGAVSKPPRFFDRVLEREDPAAHAALVQKRQASGFRKMYERSAERLQVREVCAQTRLNLFSERQAV